MSIISAGTSSSTAIKATGNTDGTLVLKTNDTGSGGTTALTLATNQAATFASSVSATAFSGPLNGTVGATTPNTGAFTTLTSTGEAAIGGSSQQVKINRVSDATAYGAITFNNDFGSTTMTGLFGRGSGGDSGRLFYNVPTGQIHNFTVAGTSVAQISSTGLAVTGVTSSTYSFESTGAVQANAANKATLSLESASTGRLCVFGADTSTFGTTVFSRAKSNGGTTESARIDDSGNLGIGTTTPASFGALCTRRGISVSGVTGSVSASFSDGANDTLYVSQDSGLSRLTFGTLTFNTGTTERARINSTGLLVGTASSTAGYALKVGGANANILIAADSPNGATLLCDSSAAGAKGAFFGHITTVSQAQVRCGASGGVYLSDGATSWTAISDERQKTDLVPITDALVKVSSLSAVTGRYVWDEKRRVFLIAQEVQQVLPEAVDVADDADGTLGLAYTDVIPLLVASIKELNAKVAALEVKNA